VGLSGSVEESHMHLSSLQIKRITSDH
jgi:hypothetical protein